MFSKYVNYMCTNLYQVYVFMFIMNDRIMNDRKYLLYIRDTFVFSFHYSSNLNLSECMGF